MRITLGRSVLTVARVFNVQRAVSVSVLSGIVVPFTDRYFEYVDGELKPIISKKVMFVGEYFGEDRDNPQALKDKKWLNPDGTPAYWINRQTGEEVEMKPGDNVPIRSVYALRSRWKIATIEALGHMIGTGGLALKIL